MSQLEKLKKLSEKARLEVVHFLSEKAKKTEEELLRLKEELKKLKQVLRKKSF